MGFLLDVYSEKIDSSPCFIFRNKKFKKTTLPLRSPVIDNIVSGKSRCSGEIILARSWNSHFCEIGETSEPAFTSGTSYLWRFIHTCVSRAYKSLSAKQTTYGEQTRVRNAFNSLASNGLPARRVLNPTRFCHQYQQLNRSAYVSPDPAFCPGVSPIWVSQITQRFSDSPSSPVVKHSFLKTTYYKRPLLFRSLIQLSTNDRKEMLFVFFTESKIPFLRDYLMKLEEFLYSYSFRIK